MSCPPRRSFRLVFHSDGKAAAQDSSRSPWRSAVHNHRSAKQSGACQQAAVVQRALVRQRPSRLLHLVIADLLKYLDGLRTLVRPSTAARQSDISLRNAASWETRSWACSSFHRHIGHGASSSLASVTLGNPQLLAGNARQASGSARGRPSGPAADPVSNLEG